MTLAPERNEIRARLGTILAVGGRLHEAAKILTEAVKFDPNDTGNLLKLGQVMAAQGELSEAVLYFREAARLRPQDAEPHESLGRALLELGKKEEALRASFAHSSRHSKRKVIYHAVTAIPRLELRNPSRPSSYDFIQKN